MNRQVIWKYPLPLEGGKTTTLSLPRAAEILTARQQEGHISTWWIVNPDETETRPIQILIMPTGLDFPEGTQAFEYVKTLFLGAYVFHVFVEEVQS